jgi:plastocyanin
MVNVGQGGNNFLDQQSGSSTTMIKAGQTVQWNWVGSFHSSTSGACCTPDGNWDSGVMSSGTFSHTFSSPGNFPYFCTVHGSLMTGMVVVSP